MKRRNFFSVLAGTLLVPFMSTKSKAIEPWNVKAAAQGRLDLMERNNEIVGKNEGEITFYGLFNEDYLNDGRPFVLLGELVGLLVFVDDRGICTFNHNDRHIGYVKEVDDNGILVCLTQWPSRATLHELPAKSWDIRGPVPSFGHVGDMKTLRPYYE